MSAGLDASTVTPGSTAPDASLTTPAIDAWAYTTDGTRMPNSSTPASTLTTLRIGSIPLLRQLVVPPRTPMIPEGSAQPRARLSEPALTSATERKGGVPPVSRARDAPTTPRQNPV